MGAVVELKTVPLGDIQEHLHLLTQALVQHSLLPWHSSSNMVSIRDSKEVGGGGVVGLIVTGIGKGPA